MNLIFRKISFTCFFLFAVFLASAQVKFSASIVPDKIGKDEYATLRLSVADAQNISQIIPPALNDFIIVSGPTQESNMTNINGQVTQSVALVYVLKPKRTGSFVLGSSVAVVGNKNYKSNRVTISVTKAPQGNAVQSRAQSMMNAFAMDAFEEPRPTATFKDYVLKKGEDIAEKVSKNMQLRLQTDKTTCYVGQPVVASYKLYTRLKSESKLSKNPSFNGFSVIDLQQPDASSYSRETVNGKEFNVYTIRKAQLYPLQPGPIALETATLDNVIQFIKEDESRSGDVYGISPDAMVSQTVSLSSKPAIIDVKPLPEENKPASFSGAVGNFNIEWAMAKPGFTTDETGTLAVRISGNGNLHLVTAPEIAWPKGIEPFEPKMQENLVNTTVPVSGNKVVLYSFAADAAGNYTIPALEFSFFDPATASYKKVTTIPLSFTVTKGTGVPAVAQFNQTKQKEISWLNSIFHHRWWIIVFIMLAVITGLFLWLRKDMSNDSKDETLPVVTSDAAKMETVVAVSSENQQNPLEETEACLYREDCVEFYAVLNKEMKAYLAQKFSLNTGDINSKTIVVAMDRYNIENSIVLQLQQLLQEVEWRLYTPFEQADHRNEMYSRSHELIQLINTNYVTVL